MTKQTQREGEALEICGDALGKLTFQWHGDRYQHAWSFKEFGPAANIHSQESESSVAWPVSPPLQQIHQQSFGDGREVIFGVGMAGRGHWSASFTLVPDLRCWIVELACRAAGDGEPLQSSYHTAEVWQPNADGNPQWHGGSKALIFEAVAPGSSVVATEHELQVKPALPSAANTATTQWAFRLRVG